MIDESLMPDIAILDPELVKSAPPFITADTGLDVITHALEAYVSETASDCSDCLAEKAAELAFEFLPRAYRNGYDIKARDKMHRASCLAGMAFNLVNLGVNHGIAHALGAIFHIPHGRANALVLPYVIEFNADMAREGTNTSNDAAKKYQKMARIVGLPAPTPKVGVANLIAEIQRLLKYMDRPQCMSECGVSVEEFNKHRKKLCVVHWLMHVHRLTLERLQQKILIKFLIILQNSSVCIQNHLLPCGKNGNKVS